MKPLVSVIIPTRDRAAFLVEAITSVLKQDYRPWELIVVDDGSQDETPYLMPRYPLLYVRGPQRGVAAARNAGLKRAKGFYVAFLDSDDLWLPQKLSAQVAFFERHPSAVAVQVEEIWIRRGRRVNPRRKHRKPSGYFFDRALKLCLVSPSGVMLRRDVLVELGGFDPSFPVCEDYELWLRLLARYPVYLIPKPLVIKRGGHEDQLSRRPGLDYYRLRALAKLLAQEPRLTPAMRLLLQQEAQKKARIFLSGAQKRAKLGEVWRIQALLQRLLKYPGLPPYVALPS